MTTQGRNKTGPLRDDEMKHELQGELKANRAIRAEEDREPEPPGEDQPQTDRAPDTPLTGGTPPGMTPEDVELRTELARHLGRAVYPADRAAVIAALRGNNAPDRLVDLAGGLPEGRQFANVQEITRALGHGTETRRT
ncbi:DUF2795 domain-containing protein [Streptomyces sp. MST-110588]|uniref:DUF2795 domain-containing protein n=1 Tax=Streptomyces sp. MST-110588 TaxID=2833628 RepID=UPI001F5C4146|nr:DUF2795 domain-containing protein [Streptomyces sp. MST-110588]UNO38939.1 DUF2795 domain-containing protein [Streptomyces sp. MST-110588]